MSMPSVSTIPRQLIAFCDGTDNTLTGGEHDTNVLKLRAMLEPDDGGQVVFYDPGVGVADQMPATSYWDGFTRKWERWQGLTSGKGIYENIGNTYRFLVENFREGDQIFLFGFSRGAFTARCVAGMVNLFGILRPQNVDLIDTLINVYFARRGDTETTGKRERSKVAEQIRCNFTDAAGHDAWVHFLGVWDIVASVGMPGMRTVVTSDGYTTHKRVRHIRHALSLDETRSSFQPMLYWDGNYEWEDRSLKQLWFRGVHTDVGGGYVESESRLSDETLAWMANEAASHGLRMRAPCAELLPPAAAGGRKVVIHNETLASPWWIISGLKTRTQRLPADVCRQIDAGRRAAPPYRPEAAPAASEAISPVFKQPHGGIVRQLWRTMLAAAVFWWAAALCASAATGGALGWLPPRALVEGAVRFDGWQRTLVFNLLRPDQWGMASGGFAGMLGDLAAMPFRSGTIDVSSAMWSLLWDTGFVIAYAGVLGFVVVRAYARRAGLRQAGETPGRLLVLLGRLPSALIGADLVENAATFLTLFTSGHGIAVLPWAFAAIMACANAAKWLLLAATLTVLLVNAIVPAGASSRAARQPAER